MLTRDKNAAFVVQGLSGVITAAASPSSWLKGKTFALTPAYSAGRADWFASATRKTRACGSIC